MSINGYDKLVDNWAGLLSAVLEHEEDLPNAGPLKYQLVRHLEKVKASKARQRFHAMSRLHCTKDLWKWDLLRPNHRQPSAQPGESRARSKRREAAAVRHRDPQAGLPRGERR